MHPEAWIGKPSQRSILSILLFCLQARLRFIRCIEIMTVCTRMMRSSSGSCSSSSVMPCKPPFALLQDASCLLPPHALHRGFLALTTSGTRQ